jgi:hypothetical protein
MVQNVPAKGMMRVVTPQELTSAIAVSDQAAARAGEGNNQQVETELAAHIRRQYELMRNHRSSAQGWNERLLHAQRVFNGQYSPQKMAEIQQFGGSTVYARLTAVKCRGATSLLREVYLGPDRPWGLDPTPEPVIPDHVQDAIQSLVTQEVTATQQAGQQLDPNQIKDRISSLVEAADRAAKKKAKFEAEKAEGMLQDRLVEGGFYKALAEFLVDLPLFPFACVKGPVVRIVPDVVWQNGKPAVQQKPKLFWERVSPFDLFFSPGVSDIEDADCIERVRFRRADLNDVLGLPGYNEDAVRAVLNDYANGLYDNIDPTDSERSQNENRENPVFNQTGMIYGLEFHGSIQGHMLLNWGMDTAQIADPDRDYFVQAWLIGRHVIKVQMSPSPRKRHPYYITSFEKVPGTPVGNALPDILEDIQDVCNAALRSLVNNLAISSGPQVTVNDDRLAPGENGDELYPWKRWHVTSDPMSSSSTLKPIEFFQPQSNAQELLGVYEKFSQIADELSAIPRYITGSERLGGAGRTSSGLAMLMGNASKILQTVAANIDRDIFQPCLQGLYDMEMLTNQTGAFRGDESIVVRGVDVAIQRETDRQRRIEFLQATMNPIDMQIIGPKGRATVLRGVAEDLNFDGEEIVPSDQEIQAMLQEQAQAAAAQAAMGQPPGPGGKPAAPGAPVTPKGNAPTAAGPGQAPPQKPDSPGLGVADGKAMRGMA